MMIMISSHPLTYPPPSTATTMSSAMAERVHLVRLYGDELLAEEDKAVRGLMRMLSYQHRIDASQLNANTISLRSASITVMSNTMVIP